mmetsp:Transcript_48304/g.134908  ORF Transcript_48304/g.134908 Transcript_48304/m.134908 type:complete len:341 (-) Transcript_48304:102-1124(-)
MRRRYGWPRDAIRRASHAIADPDRCRLLQWLSHDAGRQGLRYRWNRGRCFGAYRSSDPGGRPIATAPAAAEVVRHGHGGADSNASILGSLVRPAALGVGVRPRDPLEVLATAPRRTSGVLAKASLRSTLGLLLLLLRVEAPAVLVVEGTEVGARRGEREHARHRLLRRRTLLLRRRGPAAGTVLPGVTSIQGVHHGLSKLVHRLVRTIEGRALRAVAHWACGALVAALAAYTACPRLGVLSAFDPSRSRRRRACPSSRIGLRLILDVPMATSNAAQRRRGEFLRLDWRAALPQRRRRLDVADVGGNNGLPRPRRRWLLADWRRSDGTRIGGGALLRRGPM